jgi:hypothetical protein
VPIALASRVAPDRMDSAGVRPRHYAVLIGDEEFAAAFARLLAAGIACFGPGHEQPDEIRHRWGGRGGCFSGPATTWKCCPGSENVRISIGATNHGGAGLREIARAAGQAGVDTVRVTGHLIRAGPNASPDGAMLAAPATRG